jgi:hypothetical protein
MGLRSLAYGKTTSLSEGRYYTAMEISMRATFDSLVGRAMANIVMPITVDLIADHGRITTNMAKMHKLYTRMETSTEDQ